MKKVEVYLAALAVALCLLTACGDDDDNKVDNSDVDMNNPSIEALSMNEQWVNYLVAASSELRDDCVKLWAAWNGPTGLSAEEQEIIGPDFFTGENDLENGYAYQLKNPGANNKNFKSAIAAIEVIFVDGCANIANEVGAQKIGGPNSHGKAGNKKQGVLEVESWYSWNSIQDYSDNIVSIRNSYFGGKGNTSANGKSLSDFVKSKDAALDTKITNAINTAYTAIKTMQAPFRNNLTGDKVDAAMLACADLRTVFENDVVKLLEGADSYDFSSILSAYADEVVVKTYKEMKDDAQTLLNAALAFQADQTNQAKLDKACEAWRAVRIPWEQSEAFLFGPADALGLDPSMDRWPLDQEDILGILKDTKLSSVEKIRGAITAEEVRGFHTIELLLFKDGQNRSAKQ